MKRVYVLDAFHPAGPQWLADKVELIPYGDPRAEHWHEDADGVMVRMHPLTAEDFARAGKLKAVLKQGVGVNTIDLDAARQHGVVVANTPGINSEAVSEMALALALAVCRRVPMFDRMVRAGEPIERPKFLGYALQEKTVAVIGMGNIGARAARKFQAAFDCRILAYDPYYKPRASNDPWDQIPHTRLHDLDDVCAQADLLTVHVPLTGQTQDMISARQLGLMKPNGIVVNVSRGGIVNEADLYEALVSGHLFGAGLDVWTEREPPEPTHPLLSLPTVVATPHAAGGTVETQQRSSLKVAQELFRVLEGEEPESRVV